MKYNRSNNQLEIHHLYLEAGVYKKTLDLGVLAETLSRFTKALGAEEVVLMEGAVNHAFVKRIVAKAHKMF